MTTPTFKRITLEQFDRLLQQYPFTRQINAVHLHHTWRPRQADFRGHDTIVAMWRHHTQVNGWSDIGQHISIDPAGFIWLGRNWNAPPASASGYNGNRFAGPFMIEMIGDYDRGCDAFAGPVRDTTLRVIALLQERFDLTLDSLKFHSAMSSKTCPGSSIDRKAVLADVQILRCNGVVASRSLDAGDPFPQEEQQAVQDAISALNSRDLGDDPADAEESHQQEDASLMNDQENPLQDDGIADSTPQDATAAVASAADTSAEVIPTLTSNLPAAPRISAARLDELRPHIINLSMGRLSGEGRCSSTPGDVDAIFEQYLPAALEEARQAGRQLQVVLYACSGLDSESATLELAGKHIDWWRANYVYPLYFVWETGICDVIRNLMDRSCQAACQGLTDYATDHLIELTARALGARTLWSGMKYNARIASTPQHGGAWQVASRLKALCEAYPQQLALHAVAHSCGAIFHTYFLRAAGLLGVPAMRSLQLLAPAVRVDTFRDVLLPLLEQDDSTTFTTLYGMTRPFEQEDSCGSLYRKSLLYFIQNALEDRREVPILGLEQSLRADARLKKLLALDGSQPQRGEVVWSVSHSSSGRHASQATRHAGFDDDAATMNSVLLRVLNLTDDSFFVPYPAEPVVQADIWSGSVDLPDEVLQLQRGFFSNLFASLFSNAAITPGKIPSLPAPASGVTPTKPPSTVATYYPPTQPVSGTTTTSTPVKPNPSAGSASVSTPGKPSTTPAAPAVPGKPVSQPVIAGRRVALCVGVDNYPNPQHRLSGCVADARMWADTLGRQGFTCETLLDAQATRSNIEQKLRQLVNSSRAGDVIVFQYSGHGTHVNDLNGDEDDGQDEAICPVDFATGSLFIDDDIASAISGLPAGVNLTLFMDCCHSGTNSRFAVGGDLSRPLGEDVRRRYVIPDDALNAAHAEFRRTLDADSSRATGSGGLEQMRHAKFAACRDSEVAWESNGHGEFTLRATRVLATGASYTNQQFATQVEQAFGPSPRQHPLLDCPDSIRSLGLLRPLTNSTRGLDNLDPQALSGALQQLQLLLEQMHNPQ